MSKFFKNYKLKIINIKIFFLFVLMFVLAFKNLCALTTFLFPDPTIIDSTNNIDITINVDDSTHFRGYKLILQFDDSVLDFIGAEKGSLMTSQPVGWWVIDEESSNTVRIECIIFGAGLYVKGPGTILTLHFDGLLEGISYLNFEEYEFYDVIGIPIQDVLAENGKIIIGTPSCVCIKVLLESAYDTEGDTMKISHNNSLPLISPYDDDLEVDSLQKTLLIGYL